jgi:hypothetical protein
MRFAYDNLGLLKADRVDCRPMVALGILKLAYYSSSLQQTVERMRPLIISEQGG